MRIVRRVSIFFLVSALILLFAHPFSAWAECVVSASSSSHGAVVKHLSKGCTADERLAHAVGAEDLLQAIQQGRAIDLDGVMIVGNVLLDQLPLIDIRSVDHLPAVIQDLLTSRSVKNVRVVSQPVSIRNAHVRGTIETRLKDGYLLMRAPVTMTGTTFEGMVDLSRTLFSEPVNVSDAGFLREGFFIQTLFNKPARFERVSLGVHTRFHRAHFADTVTFERAGFNGLAEFLEVAFDKETSFSQSYFKMGTGFSGARFGGRLDFSDALFEREVFFLFANFTADASFRRAAFHGQADFSDAEFHGVGDFSKVSFAVDPLFQRTKMPGSPPTRRNFQDARFLYGIAAGFLVCTVLLIWIFKRR
jgi:uncharacterized protein YjbI with pentapeptide repeats